MKDIYFMFITKKLLTNNIYFLISFLMNLRQMEEVGLNMGVLFLANTMILPIGLPKS